MDSLLRLLAPKELFKLPKLGKVFLTALFIPKSYTLLISDGYEIFGFKI